MGNIRRFLGKFRFKGLLGITLVFAMIAVILFIELTGVRVNYQGQELVMLEKEQVLTKEQACEGLEKNALLLWDSTYETSINAMEQFRVLLMDMKVGHDVVDVSKAAVPDLSPYEVVIVLISDWKVLQQDVTKITDWVRAGGEALLPLTLEQNSHSYAIENKIGIRASYGYTYVDEIYLVDGFMIGGGRSYAIPDAYDSARTVELYPECTKVYAMEGTKEGVPLIWECNYGEGKFMVDNFGMCDKAYRGFFAASLSMLTDAFVYPVINGSTFYLDDFPSQIPGGSNPYITRDYNTSVRDFYLNVWWPDMMNLCDQYGLKYTGLAIECYDDAVDGTTDASPDKLTFSQLGNMLLRKGGELGYHGYNHQPLALGNKDYHDVYDYKTWTSYEAMEKGFSELVDFCDELFPGVEMAVYVPPSNLLTTEGREMLSTEFPHITTYSGIYLPDDVLDFALLQEFEVDENGVVDQPRIISGCDIDDFMTVGALSELNFHFVNDHFTHPDDALDPDRGAAIGWKELKKRFTGFLDWLYGSAKGLRNLTGSEMSAAVQRFAAVTIRQEIQEDKMVLQIDHFYDNAQFLVRFNEKEPGNVTHGKLTHLTGELYLLEAYDEQVTIALE